MGGVPLYNNIYLYFELPIYPEYFLIHSYYGQVCTTRLIITFWIASDSDLVFVKLK